MICPIRETESPSQGQSGASDDVRRLVASLFLDEARENERPAPSVPGWKAWLLIAWAAVVTLAYMAAMLDLI